MANTTEQASRQDAEFGRLDDAQSSEVRAWAAAQQLRTEAALDAAGTRDLLRAAVRGAAALEERGLPQHRGETVFQVRRGAEDEQWSVWVKEDTERLLLDAGDLSEDGNTAISLVSPSPDGSLLAWASARAGSDWEVIRVRDVRTGADLEDRLEWVKAAQAAWLPDGSGFFYFSFDAPAEGNELLAVSEGQRIRFHRLGTAQSDDLDIFSLPDTGWLSVYTPEGSGRVVVEVTDGTTTVGIHVAAQDDAIERGADAFTAWVDGDDPVSFLGWSDGVVYSAFPPEHGDGVIRRVTEADAEAMTVAVPEGPLNAWVSEVVDGTIAVGYHSMASHSLGWTDLDSGQQRTLTLPEGEFIGQLRAVPGTSRVHALVSGWRVGTKQYEIDLASGTCTETYDEGDGGPTAAQLVEVGSTDGAAVPLAILTDPTAPNSGPRPTLLVGYGGYSADFLTYGYHEWHRVWLELGGAIALAGIRGGSERGEAWHRAATREHKQRSYDDFIACAEWLIDNDIADAGGIVINGMSNGGLLVGAVMTQRPDLFAVALPEVGVMDLLRFHEFTVGAGWIREFGDPDVSADRERLASLSPLHQLRPGVDYPPTLVLTADHDDRVVPGPHSYAFLDKLQRVTGDIENNLLRVQPNAGHAAGKSRSTLIAERADMLCFALDRLNLNDHVHSTLKEDR